MSERLKEWIPLMNTNGHKRLSDLLSFFEPRVRLLTEVGESKVGKQGEKTVLSTCTTDCGGTCTLWVHLREGTIRNITPFKDGKNPPLTPCIRGLKSHHRVYAPDRLKYPLKRMGDRGSGRFKRITWEEALSTISDEMQRIKQSFGPEAILECSGAGSILVFLHSTEKGALFTLLNEFGGRTALGTNTSFEGASWASQFTYGITSGEDANSLSDLLNARLIILWGLNPAENRFGTETLFWLKKAKDAGIKIIVVDPCLTDTVRTLNAIWFPVRPSTDTALLNAMAHVILRDGLHDKEFVDHTVFGVEDYRRYLTGETDGVSKTPEWAETITGVPAERIRLFAREYATIKPAALIQGWAPGRTAGGEQYHRAAIAIQALTGNIGIHGGSGSCCGVQKRGGNGKPSLMEMLSSLNTGYNSALKAGGRGTEISSGKWADAVLRGKSGGYPSDIRMIYVAGHNILNQRANVKKGIEAFKKVDFVVCQDLFLTPTARYSDIVLPVTTSFEREDIRIAWVKGYYIVYCKKVIEPLWDSKTDLEIARALAERLGVKGFENSSEEETLKELFGCTFLSSRVRFEELKEQGLFRIEEEPFIAFQDQVTNPEKIPFSTPTGKIEIYSKMLEQMNPDDPSLSPVVRDYREIPRVPSFLSCEELPGSAWSRKYPLQLTTPHSRYRVHSQFYTTNALRRLYRHEVWIHRLDAKKRDIRDEDMVLVFNDRGSIVVHAKVTERIMPGVVRCYEGAWYEPDEQGLDRGGCVNVLIDDTLNSASGASNCNTCMVEIRKESG